MADPIEYIKDSLSAGALTKKQLLDVFGTRARTSDILNRRRTLSINHIRALHFRLGLNASVLIQPYERRAYKSKGKL